MQDLEIPLMQSPTFIKPLRLKYKQVCELLNIERNCLQVLMKTDENFPKPMKNGKSKQAAVYFDTEEIEIWYKNYRAQCRSEN